MLFQRLSQLYQPPLNLGLQRSLLGLGCNLLGLSCNLQKKTLLSSFLILTLFLSPAATAEEIPETFSGVRPLGMGNASTGLANDHNAVWTNPAGIARLRKARSRKRFHHILVPELIAGFNTAGKKFAQEVQSQQGTKATAVSSALEDYDTAQGKSIWARASSTFASFFDAPKGVPWGVGIFTNNTVTLLPDPDQNDSVQIDSISDLGAVTALAWTNSSNRISFGLQLRPTTRYGYTDKIAAQELADKSVMEDRIKQRANSGFGLGVDVGALWTMADYWFPTFGVAVRNLPTGCVNTYLNPFAEVRQKVCGTKFGGTIHNAESLALLDPTDIRLGLSLTPRLAQKLALRFAADIHHLSFSPDNKIFYGLSHIEPLKLLHAGIELFVGNPLQPSPFSLRFGFNQGFITTGLTLRWRFFLLEATSYGQDTSSAASGREDRRSLVSLSVDIS